MEIKESTNGLKLQDPILDKNWTIELSGEELLHIWHLSYTKEGGIDYPNHPPTGNKQRVHRSIENAFPAIHFERYRNLTFK